MKGDYCSGNLFPSRIKEVIDEHLSTRDKADECSAFTADQTITDSDQQIAQKIEDQNGPHFLPEWLTQA